MACVEHAIRVKVDFGDLDRQTSWMSLNQNKCPLISDVEKKIVNSFSLGDVEISLSLSGHCLPRWEDTAGVLRENDTVQVAIDSEEKPRKLKKKRKKIECSEEIRNEELDSRADANNDNATEKQLKKRKKELLDVLDNLSQTHGDSENEDTKSVDPKQNNFVKPSGEVIPETSSTKKKRKRKKKKGRTSPSLEKSENDLHLGVKVIKEPAALNLPSWKQPSNKRITFDKDQNDESEKMDVCSDPVSSNSQNVSKEFKQSQTDRYTNVSNVFTNHESISVVENGSNGDGTFSDISPRIEQRVLPNGVAVYKRLRNNRQFAKSSPSLENHPVDENGVKDSSENTSSRHYNQKLDLNGPSRDNSRKPIVDAPPRAYGQNPCQDAPKRDYSQYLDLDGPPRQGDNIAYKIVELSSNYCPQISQYKEAKVLSYDPITTMVELKPIAQDNKGKATLGKFDLPDDDDDDDDQNKEDPNAVISGEFGSLLETKLIA